MAARTIPPVNSTQEARKGLATGGTCVSTPCRIFWALVDMSQATRAARFVAYRSAQSTAHTLTRIARLTSSIAVHQPHDSRHHRRLRTPSGLPREVTRLKQNCAITAWTVVSLTSRTVLRRAVHSPTKRYAIGGRSSQPSEVEPWLFLTRKHTIRLRGRYDV